MLDTLPEMVSAFEIAFFFPNQVANTYFNINHNPSKTSIKKHFSYIPYREDA